MQLRPARDYTIDTTTDLLDILPESADLVNDGEIKPLVIRDVDRVGDVRATRGLNCNRAVSVSIRARDETSISLVLICDAIEARSPASTPLSTSCVACAKHNDTVSPSSASVGRVAMTIAVAPSPLASVSSRFAISPRVTWSSGSASGMFVCCGATPIWFHGRFCGGRVTPARKRIHPRRTPARNRAEYPRRSQPTRTVSVSIVIVFLRAL